MIARALAQEPVLLVLDEPTAFLDVPSRVELMGLLRQLTRDGSLAVVVSTHDLELALRTADVVWLVMPGGELMTGAPEDVSSPAASRRRSRAGRFAFTRRSAASAADRRPRHAAVRGTGFRAAMARAVLEREGYASSRSRRPRTACRVDGAEAGWRVSAEAADMSGDTFGRSPRICDDCRR